MLHLVLSWADTALMAACGWERADVAHYRAAFRLAALVDVHPIRRQCAGCSHLWGTARCKGDKTEALRRNAVHRIGWMNTAVAIAG